ncbi:MAG: cellulase family glycosylhydrolase [Cyclobacteriaceae bacterium]|nr:cellulase family glycosylhydrolase [Cyclobacteriaceae bacterium]
MKSGKNLTIIVAILVTGVLFGCNSQKKEAVVESDKTPVRFALKRGVNISHWLSQSKVRGPERADYFTKSDVDFIASIGYDHIRIPIDEEQMWDEQGVKEAEAFTLLHNAIGWAIENNLKVIVDLHILRSHHFNEKEKPLWTDPNAQEQFYQCWRDLSAELIKYPTDFVAYELMNEPVADDPQEWNKLVANASKVVRENEPQRFIVIGSNMWQSASTFNELEVPANDPYIILSFHFYNPFLLTHHTASWTDIAGYSGPVNYPGLLVEDADIAAIADDSLRLRIQRGNGVFNRDSLEAMMVLPFQKAESLNLQLYCGEFGCLPTVPREDLLQWYRDMRSILETHEVGWTNWDYKGGFGIVDRQDGNKPIDDLIEVLVK